MCAILCHDVLFNPVNVFFSSLRISYQQSSESSDANISSQPEQSQISTSGAWGGFAASRNFVQRERMQCRRGLSPLSLCLSQALFRLQAKIWFVTQIRSWRSDQIGFVSRHLQPICMSCWLRDSATRQQLCLPLKFTDCCRSVAAEPPWCTALTPVLTQKTLKSDMSVWVETHL